MNERPIGIGDTVYVAKLPVCGCDLALGWVFTVDEIWYSPFGTCITCGADRGPDDTAGPIGIEVWRLKRIPPLGDLEGLESQEGIVKAIDIPLEV